MIRALALAIFTLALSGCSATTATLNSPTPVAMTTADSGQMYLNAICPGNIASEKLTVDERVANPDFATVNADIKSLVSAFTHSTHSLDSGTFLWPAEVADSVKVIADSDYESLSWAQEAAKETTLAGIASAQLNRPSTPGASAASQKIRARLGLDADTTTSCVGHDLPAPSATAGA